MQTGHDYLLVEHKVAPAEGSSLGLDVGQHIRTHRNTDIDCATSDIFLRHPSFLCPSLSHRFIFFVSMSFLVFGFGDFLGPLWCQLKLVRCVSKGSAACLRNGQGNGECCFECKKKMHAHILYVQIQDEHD